MMLNGQHFVFIVQVYAILSNIIPKIIEHFLHINMCPRNNQLHFLHHSVLFIDEIRLILPINI